MMGIKQAFPYVMGAAMGAMMFGVFHDDIAAGRFGAAAVIFVAAHVAVVAVVGGLLWLGARRFGARVHRPSAGHVARMLGAAGLAMALIHLVHGGPA